MGSLPIGGWDGEGGETRGRPASDWAGLTLPLRLLCGLCPGALGRFARTQEFQVPDEVLGLIYAQTVVWVGSFFCPLLPLLNTVKFLLLFYLKKVSGGEQPWV